MCVCVCVSTPPCLHSLLPRLWMVDHRSSTFTTSAPSTSPVHTSTCSLLSLTVSQRLLSELTLSKQTSHLSSSLSARRHTAAHRSSPLFLTELQKLCLYATAHQLHPSAVTAALHITLVIDISTSRVFLPLTLQDGI